MMFEKPPRLIHVAGKDNWYVYYKRGRHSTGTTRRADAERFLADFIAELSRPAARAGSVHGIESILAAYLADRRRRQIPGAERLAWAHKPLTRFFGEKPPETITEDACIAYSAQRGVAIATVRTELQALRAALRWAGAAGGLSAVVPVVTMPSRPPARDRWLTREEAAKLIEACRADHVRLFVVVALNTAARRGAVLGLTWDRVDLERRRIDFNEPGRPVTKKGRSRVPMNDTLFAALTIAKPRAETPFVIEYSGQPVASVKHGFADACRRAGISGASPHTLRHTAATWMVQRGVPLWEVAGVLGHSDTKMLEQVYAHHSRDFLGAAVAALG